MKMRLARLTLFALIVAGTTALTGCWDIKDINHRALPIVMGVKQTGQSYKVLLLVPDTRDTETSAKIISESGNTINEILDKINKNMENKVDLLHLKVIVFERSVAEKGLGQSIESFMRSRDIPNKTFCAISVGMLEPLFEKLSTASKIGGMEVYDFFEKNAGWSPEVVQTRIWEVFRSMDSYTRDVVIPTIRPGRTTTIESTGAAVIKNGKMVGTIDSEKALLYNLFKGAGTQGKIEVMHHATVKIEADRLTNSSKLHEGQATLSSLLHLKVTVLETVGDPSESEIKREIDDQLSARFQTMLRDAQSKEADFLGLGQLFRDKLSRDDLQAWRSKYYPFMKIHFKVHVIIQDEGLLKSKS
ncbi:Ger(x)C family spore germination protein [Cohnella hashimotonis]|uniref:Ger(X)C family spore germination protein n=1 Tax=Cohnella hashimotonis TaxID=2826895 RepID=A0ABT6TDS5_9BACL|nr:Ger(x)C family spore germination protein [Cohnella hashimotonis]MDI4644976.1 Ger(x)C family spore germination protein [Cohnella hashimotonis]